MTIRLTREEVETAIEVYLSDKGVNVPLGAKVVFYQDVPGALLPVIKIYCAEVCLRKEKPFEDRTEQAT